MLACPHRLAKAERISLFRCNPSARENTNEEGIQAVRTLARNMAYYLRCIEAGREKGIVPLGQEQVTFTNFIR